MLRRDTGLELDEMRKVASNRDEWRILCHRAYLTLLELLALTSDITVHVFVLSRMMMMMMMMSSRYNEYASIYEYSLVLASLEEY